jgi:hypothetical protein
VYVITLGVLLTPLILSKELKELKIVSMTLMASIILFELIFLFELVSGNTANPD